MERFNFIFVVAGVLFFGLAFVIMGALPMVQYQNIGVVSMETLSQDVPYQFRMLARDYPEAFAKAFGTTEANAETFREALDTGRAAYIAEACWHCHSQQIRRIDPNTGTFVGNDAVRFAPKDKTPSVAEEYHNEMNYPHLFGTRRVGPDLIRQSGVHSNDWHLAHFWHPREVTPYSVMPRYTWFFEDEQGLVPNKIGLSMVAYMQWLGSWHEQFAPSEYEEIPQLPFDDSWYPPYVPPTEEEFEEEGYDDDGYGGYGEDEGYGDDSGYGDEGG